MQVDFLGPYYSVLGVFSDWRGMGSAVRMISVSLSRPTSRAAWGTAVLEDGAGHGGDQ